MSYFRVLTFVTLLSLSSLALGSDCLQVMDDLKPSGGGSGRPPGNPLPQELEIVFTGIETQYGPMVIKNKTVGFRLGKDETRISFEGDTADELK